MDESNLQITISFWGSLARRDDYQENMILAVKAARVSDYNGKSLNAGDEQTQVYLEPKHVRTTKLKQWFKETQGASRNFSSVTTAPAGAENGMGQGQKQDNYRLIKEMQSDVSED